MKGLLRFLLVSPLLLLVVIVRPGGPEVGAAADGVAATQNSNGSGAPQKPPPRRGPSGPTIQSFTATPPSIRKGEATTLRWQVSNADQLWVYPDEREDAKVQVQGPSGELRVTPERNTTYHLRATKWSMSTIGRVNVQVLQPPPPPGFCTIFGRIGNDRREYGTKVTLHLIGSGRQLGPRPVEPGGVYRFSNVPEGNYRVVPTGSYGGGEKTPRGPRPRSQDVQCQRDGSHRADFVIDSLEG